MGSLLPALDNLLINLLRQPMIAYQFHQYESAAKGIYNLNMFLNGYGIGMELQPPRSLPMNIFERANPWVDYRTYYDRNFPMVIKSVGMYIRDVLKSLKNQHYVPEADVNDQVEDLQQNVNSDLPPSTKIEMP